MSSLVAWVGVTEKKRLRVVEVDAERHADLAEALEVSTVPSLVLLRGREDPRPPRRPGDRERHHAPDRPAHRDAGIAQVRKHVEESG